jgi:hypothetical protein
MPSMLERRLLTASIGVPLTLGLAMLDVQGLLAFVGLSGVIFVSAFAGIMAEPWLRSRRHHTQS